MKKHLRELLYMIKDEKLSQEAQKDLDELERLMKINESKLLASLDAKQRDTFEKYCDCVNEFYAIELENAFIKGASFTSRFLCEALL